MTGEFGFGMEKPTIFELIKQWSPKEWYSGRGVKPHNDFRDDLAEFLESKNLPWNIDTESPRFRADIQVGKGEESIAIDIKTNVNSQSKVNDIVAAVEKYRRGYKKIYIVVCGAEDRYYRRALSAVKDMNSRGGLDFGFEQKPTVKLIRKEEKIMRKKEKEKGPKKRMRKGREKSITDELMWGR